MLEPDARKRARPVLRGPRPSNGPGLPDEVPDADKDALALAEMTKGGLADQDQYEEQVLALNADVNKQLRTIKTGSARR